MSLVEHGHSEDQRTVIWVASRPPTGGVSVSGLAQQALLGYGNGEHVCVSPYEVDDDVEDNERLVGEFETVRNVRALVGFNRWRNYGPGFATRILWTYLMHPHMPASAFLSGTEKDEWWSGYNAVNNRVAREVLRVWRECEHPEKVVVWAHDYHFYRLAHFMYASASEDNGVRLDPVSLPPVGLQIHTPWPKVDSFAQCPYAKKLVKGMLKFDVLGFQTAVFRDNFAELTKHFGLKCPSERLVVLPVAIDPARFRSMVPQPYDHPHLLGRDMGCKWIIAVERIEPVKGSLERLRALDLLLGAYPELVGNIQLIQAGINPEDGRLRLRSYRLHDAEDKDRADEINTKYGNDCYQPVVRLRSLSHQELMYLFHDSRAAVLVNSSRIDGMGLTLQEAAAMGNEPPVCAPLLSCHAGSTALIGGDNMAVVFDPLVPGVHMRALLDGLTMPRDEARRRMNGIRAVSEKYTTQQWVKGFVESVMRNARELRVNGVVDE